MFTLQVTIACTMVPHFFICQLGVKEYQAPSQRIVVDPMKHFWLLVSEKGKMPLYQFYKGCGRSALTLGDFIFSSNLTLSSNSWMVLDASYINKKKVPKCTDK